MHTNRTKFTAGLGSLAASSLLLLAVPTGRDPSLAPAADAMRRRQRRRLPRRSRVLPRAPPAHSTGTRSHANSHAAGSGAAVIKTAHQTASPT